MTAFTIADALEALEDELLREDLPAASREVLLHLVARGRAIVADGGRRLAGREGVVILEDLGEDGPPFLVRLVEPPLETAGRRVEAEYLIDPGPIGTSVAECRFTRLDGPLEVVPVTRDQAEAFIAEHHRTHRRRPAGWRFGAGLVREATPEALVAVAWAGNPTARNLDNGVTLELQRVAIRISHNAATKIIGAIARAATALGFRRLVTYTGGHETGASLKAAGFGFDKFTRGGEAGRPGRPRQAAEDPGRKARWVRDLR